VNDLFDNRNFFFIEEGVLFIGDKASSKENSLRVIPLCSIAIEQLTLYVSHIDSLAFRLSKFDLLLAQKITFTSSIKKNHFSPYLFEISEANELIGLKKAALQQFWGEKFTLPPNFNRHLLSTYLSESGLKREYINYFMGHLAAGQSPFSHTSPLNIVTALQPLSKCLDQLCQELNLKPLSGLKKGKHHEIIDLSEFRPKRNIVGSLLRQKVRVEKEKQINKKVKGYFDKEYPNILSRNAFHPLSKGNIEQIKIFLKSLPKSQVGKAFEITRKIITRFYRKFNKKPPIIWFVEKNEASGLLPLDVTFQLQQAKKIKVVLESLIVNSFVTSNVTFTDKLALSYLYALSDNLNHKTEIKDYLTSLKGGMVLTRDAVYLINRVDGEESHWFPNTKQLLLISNLKYNWPSVSPTQRNLTKSIRKLLNIVMKDAGLKVLQLTQYISFFRYNYIFKRSAAEYKQQKGKGLFTFNHKSLSSKEDLKINKINLNLVDGIVFEKVSTSVESLNLIDELKPIRNSIRNMKRLEQRTEFKKIIDKYITSSDEFAYVLANWGLYMLQHGIRKTTSPAISTLITYLSVNTKTFNELLAGKSLLEMHDFECSCLIEEVLEINGTGKHQLSSILNFIDFLEVAANKKNILIEAVFSDIDRVDVNYFSDDEIEKLREAQWGEEERLCIEVLLETGCRPSEAYSRIVNDIDVIGKSLQFRTNILSKLKNEFSIRPFPFSKLSEDLVQLLIKVKSLHEGKRPIFDVSEESYDQVNYKRFCYSLNKKIKSLLKRNISIKHFRHTFSRKQFIANPNSSLRSVWQDSALLGHSSPATSQHNYIHDAFQENQHLPISDSFLSATGLIKEATIRKKRSRNFKHLNTEIANSHILLNSLINKLMT
jgi:integrase